VPVRLTIDADEFELGEDAIRRIGAGLVDLRGFWPLLGPPFLEWMRLQFSSRGAFAGSPWAPLSLAYAAYKSVKYPGRGILVAEGDLRRAALSPRREQTPRTVTFIIDKWGELAGDDRLDPSWHQEGTDRMPARPILFGGDDLPARVKVDLEQAADHYVADLVRRLGRRV
jgi:hypothetical protein